MVLVESKKYLVPLLWRSQLYSIHKNEYAIGFWNELAKEFIPHTEVIRMVNLYKNNTNSSMCISDHKTNEVYHVKYLVKNLKLRHRIKAAGKKNLIIHGKLCYALEKYCSTYNLRYLAMKIDEGKRNIYNEELGI